MPQPLRWTKLTQTGQNQPGSRSGHTITTVGKQHILFGGLEGKQGKGEVTKPTNHVFKIRLANNNVCDWSLIQCSGDLPQPRTNHAACAIEQDRLLIFGGYYTSKNRFNDVYILKLTGNQWTQPPNQKSQGSPKNAESKIGAPDPRADTTATYHKGKVYIFGGHGGVGYTRQSFNDLYTLDIESFEWSLVEPQGNPPDPRGGHVASILAQQDKLIIYGGWSFTSQFSNVMIYDIEKNEWIDPEISHEQPKWNLTAIMAPSIPSWKYFIFGGSIGSFEEGGNRTTSKYVDDTYYLDVDLMEWKTVELQPEQDGKSITTPSKRESASVFYDSQDQRVIIFGGWSNNWLNDMWSLNVSMITGPPYAIFGIKPNLGPLTGKTKVIISGEGFKQHPNIKVKFYFLKQSAEVNAQQIDEQTLTCETPSFEQFGPKKVSVVVSINNADYTIIQTDYQYYLNTKAEHTIAYGPGVILDNNVAGEETQFVIQARNTSGLNRESGADFFQVSIIRPDKLKENLPVEEVKEASGGDQRPGSSQQGAEQQEEEEKKQVVVEEVKKEPEVYVDLSIVPFKIVDKDDGSYLVTFKVDDPCEVLIDVKYKNENNEHVQIRGNPFKAKFVQEGDAKQTNHLHSQAIKDYIKNAIMEMKEFIKISQEDIDYKEKNLDDVKQVITIMAAIAKIARNNTSDILKLEIIEEMLRPLKKHFGETKELNDWSKECKNLLQEWSKLILVSNTVDKTMKNIVDNHMDKTKENIKKQEEKMKEYQNSLKKEPFYFYETGCEGAFASLQEVTVKVQEFKDQLSLFDEQAIVFNFPEELNGCYKYLDQIQSDVLAITKLWEHIKICQSKFDDYQKMKWGSVNTMDMEDEIKKMRKGLTDQKNVDRRSSAFQGINEQLKAWNIFLPLLGELKDHSMETEDGRHWKKLKDIVQREFDVDDQLELRTVWDLKLYEYKDAIEEITDQSKQELKMEKQLNIIINFWKNILFELIPHKASDIKTLKMTEENVEQLEEHQLQINNMLLSKYVAFYEEKVEKWKQDLGSIYDVTGLLIEVQKTWSFLENLFIQSEEVKKELPNESKQFVGIDQVMREIMKNGNDIKNCLNFCTQQGLLQKLEQIQRELKVCEKALNEFLDSKRRAFPRFYFVSQEALLDILSNGNAPEKINVHMSKIFQAIENLTLKESGDRPTMTEMISCVGVETVPLIEKKLEGKDIVNTMRKTLNKIASTSFKAFQQLQKSDWIKRDPAQITLLVNNIIWSAAVEDCFIKLQGGEMNTLKDFKEVSISALTDLIKMVQGKLDKPLRQKVMCLITLDAHSRDMVIKLIQEHVRKPDEFQWQSQLKFYWDSAKDDSLIRIADAHFWYNYEYLGNGPRLVVTPLTDRIYVTATQAMHLNMGCAPAGPAGTGKTETTKDLANALAKACYVFNCSSEMNYICMGNIYKGLASSGCWGCFDEFNRLLPEVLSVCSVQFKAVTDAVKIRAQKFIIEGDEISLDPTCGAFITMNPGYLGRAELPEGLKALFRPITVVVPDLELICENMLMAEGFVNAKLLAKKFVTLYMLCRDLLSKQKHYDWGLRAIKSVLVVAGGFKRAEPDISENALLMRALRDFNIPKIAYQDLYVFFGLLGDLFPGIDIPRQRDIRFEGVIKDVCIENKLFPEEEFILKVVQLGELLAIRHCVFIMGPAGAGKTTTWQMLVKSNEKDQKKTIFIDMDPKVVSTKDFYGYNTLSKEWKDGLFSKSLRDLGQMTDTNPKWIVLDGDLDANWIESMNSVMDDNKILTLANNERIPLKPHMRAVFEIRDLNYATPATVSRAGILYISDDSGHQWRSYVKSWIQQSVPKAEDKKTLQTLFDRYIPETLQYLRKNAKYLIPVLQISQVISICNALQPMLNYNPSNIEFIFVYATVWGIGGALAEKDGHDYRKEFSNWWKSYWKTQVKFPSKGTIFDYFVEISQDGACKFSEWTTRLQPTEFDPTQGQMMSNITVSTIQTLATSDFIKNFLLVKHPSLMIGNAGCGKTQLAKGILKDIVSGKPDSYAFQLINFNYYTDASYLQIQLEQTLEKKAGKQYGPPGKLQMIYFVDDLNMPQRDSYNTQTAIALLRQHADYGHWYDVAKLTQKDIINTQVLAAMNPSAGSFYVNPRYQRHFWTVSIPFPDNESLHLIYVTFLNGQLKRFKPAVQEQSNGIVRATLLLHQAVSATFKKTAINFHYEFNLRHVSNIYQGMLLSSPDKYQEPDKIIKLWIHECERTYGDRLVSYDHLKLYRENMFDIVKKSFTKFNFARYFTADKSRKDGKPTSELIYCNFTGGINADRSYDQMSNDKLQQFVEEGLKEYNDNNAFMGLVLFEDALKHVCRVCRIILPPSGHALLVGVGGSGKQSLSKLSSFMMTMTTFQITISATYGMQDLKTDLQNLFFKCAPKEEQILFLFTEGQITNERFLVYINDLLSSGEIADLYTLDEKEAMINNVKGEGKPDTRENCWQWFVDAIKKNLHMSICFSPVGDMRRRARQFPALVNCTVIDWFHPWPYEALFGVAKQFLEPVDLGEESVRDSVVKFMPFSFSLVNNLGIKLLEQERRYAYTTPKSFLELIKLFTNMLSSKRENLMKSIETYENGLVKLKETEEQVAIIEIEVKEKQIEAEAKKKEADEFAEIVGKEKDIVEKENAIANIEAEKCAVIKADVEEKKTSTQKDLDAAQPLVDEALSSLDTITKKDFQTAKSWASPPAGVPEVFAATLYLLAGFFPEAIEIDKNKKPKASDWKASLKMLKSPDQFVEKLKGFKETVDANLIPPGNVQAVKSQYLSLDTFKPEVMGAKSTAAQGVCSWVINIVKYWDVIQDIEPKRKMLKEATEQLEEASIKLKEVEDKVAVLNQRLGELTAKFDKAIAEKNAAVAEAERCSRRLNLAQRLVSALGSEKERWAKSIVTLQGQMELIVGDVIMASSFVSYAGPFNKKFRNIMINEEFMKFVKEQHIPVSNDPNPVKILTAESVIALWNKQNLPSDQVSVENGTILTNSERYPLMIDPQLQGITWIREKEKQNKLKSLRLGSRNINRDLEMSIENGYSALIENMDEKIDAILMPVIARMFIRRGKKLLLKFAGKDLIVHDNFRLFLHTKLSNPHYPPEIQAEAALINFMVTEQGLGDQLLTLVVGRERPDLAKKKVELITQQNDFKIKLKELEVGLLTKLSNAKGDILDDIELIENLEYSKKLSTEIEIKVAIAKITEAKINETSENYRPVSNRGALFYFLLSDLMKIHSFYKYSLDSFVTIIHRSIDAISENKMFKGVEMVQYTGKEDQIQVDNKDEEEGEEEQQEEEQEQVQEEQPKEEIKEDVKQAEEKKKEEGDEGEEGQEKAEGEEGGEKGTDGEHKEEKKKKEEVEEEPLSPRSLKKRIVELIDSLTYTGFQSTRRGLFEKHKIIVGSMLVLRILLRGDELNSSEVDHLIIGKMDPQPPPMPDVLKSFLSDTIWSACKALESIHLFASFTSSLETEYLQWKKWYQEEKAEIADLPRAFKECSKFHRLLLLRAMRPDRLSSALTNFVMEKMGERYIEQPAFDIREMFQETTKTVPVFFVLFPGVDPTPDVEKVAADYEINSINRRFINISMGQGQEEPAKKALFDCAKRGYWIMLQNVHLMQSWLYGLGGLEGFLEQIFNDPKTHTNFRVFISSEPYPDPMWQVIPESILQSSLKIANEAPQYLKANLRRAYNKFSQQFLDKCDKKPTEFKSCLFALCFFHSLMLGRKKFGSQGWSRTYNFNDGDLTICGDVLYNYLSKYDVVPWADLRYIFGEIMYGGHITDDWDRRTNRTYLEVLIKPELLQLNFPLAPGFKSPDPVKFDYEKYKAYIETSLPGEAPQMFGMHPNAEIGYLTTQCETIFNTILEVQGGAGGDSGGAKVEDVVMGTLKDFQSRTPDYFNLMAINERIKDKNPFVVVCLQEAERMNGLLEEIKKSLDDLLLGLTGQLNMTDAMETLSSSLQFNKTPKTWEEKAYPSKKPLALWFNDMIERVRQLSEWSKELITPNSLCISYLFNPMSFLTAIMQNTARIKEMALDNMTIQTNVVAMRDASDCVNPAENGAYVHGLYLEGAAWEVGGEGSDGGYLMEQRPKELHPRMPLINVIALPLDQKKNEGQYMCPVYVTSGRGPTYVFTANLNMEDDSPAKWILSGTCLLMSDD